MVVQIGGASGDVLLGSVASGNVLFGSVASGNVLLGSGASGDVLLAHDDSPCTYSSSSDLEQRKRNRTIPSRAAGDFLFLP
jgi:hypothetical protein